MKGAKNRYSAVIVENYAAEAEYLEHMIREYTPDLEVDQVFKNSVEASRYLAANNPDFLFLDIDMPQINGLEIAEMMKDKPQCAIIFVTGHTDYAIEALNMGIPYYLVKPFRPVDVRNMVNRVIAEKIRNNPSSEIFGQKLIVNRNDRVNMLELKEILYFDAEGSYTNIYMINNTSIKSSKPLKYYKSQLADLDYFIEINRSIILNMMHIREIEKTKNGGNVVLSNNFKIKLALNTTKALTAQMQHYIWRGSGTIKDYLKE